MEKAIAVAKLKHLRIAPRKVRLVIGLIRGSKVEDAVVQLENSKKSAARPVLKLLNSAVANSKHNHEMKVETLVIKEAMVDEGATLHRWMPRAMGRATPLRKRSSHITLVLEGEVEEKKTKKDKKTTEAKKEKKTKEDKDNK
ncbi:MAG: 50S ribosomal protein L22 [Candidatus Magasanikbacteria bacterium]|jgi:large subunit ribosomal protein L22|nr:50S ribosomal protein L22 [Candidatus Magasanikbacteria bacterium]MBT4314660.1 50S ribosomal protein L22 [Candidatus Magasanikbacteria bacterium]MBT4547080.1 50S ribosomal protein L22 [Candidatus Magasanikbacteria bacterium]MBT6819540.1 50S ribosomal protein L22 [Candidatus Magasanikbacteria bacterium]